MKRHLVSGFLVLGINAIASPATASPDYEQGAETPYGEDYHGSESDYYESRVSKRQIRQARKSISLANQIVFAINDLITKIEQDLDYDQRGNYDRYREYNDRQRVKEGRDSRRRFSQYESDTYALLAIKQLPIRIQRGSDAMLQAVRAAESGDFSTYYTQEQNACYLWRDARVQARTSKRILDMDGNTGVIYRSDFREITRDISRLLQESNC